MYITINNLKKSLGKYIEMKDLYIGLPIFFLFLVLFSFEKTRLLALIELTIGIFLMIPISVSKKNRMYKIIGLLFKYLIVVKEYIYFKEENFEKRKSIK